MNEQTRIPKTSAAPAPTFTPLRSNLLQRQCSCGAPAGIDGACPACRSAQLRGRGGRLQQASVGLMASIDERQSMLENIPSGAGEPLRPEWRQSLAPGFGSHLEQVRIHDDTTAHRYVAERKAYAVTIGQHIYLGSGYRNRQGDLLRLLAHEVAHTAQQRSAGGVGGKLNLEQYQELERQADQAADRAVLGQQARVNGTVGSQTIQAAAIEPGSQPVNTVQTARMVVLALGFMTKEQRRILLADPAVYHDVVQQLIRRDANWITDKLLEIHVSDAEEQAIIDRLHRWAVTPKIEGGNYLDNLLDAIRSFSYRFSYVISESARGNMIDKLFAEIEGERQTQLIHLVDTYSVRYRGYRGRGGMSRWSGIQTAVMPKDVRARINRINQRLAGKSTVPMTAEEIRRINALYAQLRKKTWGMVDLPDISLRPALGQQAAPAALAIPAIGVAALIYALVMAILVTIALALIIAILIEIEQALERAEALPKPQEVPVPRPQEVPVPKPPGKVIPIESHPRYQPNFKQAPQTPKKLGPDIVPIPRVLPEPKPDPEEKKRRRKRDAYPLCWAVQLGPPMLAGIAITRFIRTPNVERDTNDAYQRRLQLIYRQQRDPGFIAREYHVHHSVPLFLGGLDAAPMNLTIIPGKLHLKGHSVLAHQPQMLRPPPGLKPLPKNIYKHPPGTTYELVGFKSERDEICPNVLA